MTVPDAKLFVLEQVNANEEIAVVLLMKLDSK